MENLGSNGTFLDSSQEGITVGEYIDRLETVVNNLDNNTEVLTGTSGAEIKQIYQAVKNNDHLRDVVIQDVHVDTSGGGGKSALLVDPSSNEAIVAFKGTQGDKEWADNFSGLTTTDTDYQKNALEWYQSLDLDGYDTITVTGHSKGGNKAKYITLLDDSVDNCFSFDGQGFSDEFIDKYAGKINKNGDKILNVSAESDFVNILLNDVGHNEYYAGNNYGDLGFAENHCPNTILSFDADGNPVLTMVPQDERMIALDHMLNSYIRSADPSQKEAISEMLGQLVVCGFKGDTEGMLGLLANETYKDAAVDLVAYILKYKKENPEMMDHIKSILEECGVSGFDDAIGVIDWITNNEWAMSLIGKFPGATIWALETFLKDKIPPEVLEFLKAHPELLALLEPIAERMKEIDVSDNGEDKKPDPSIVDTSSNSGNGIDYGNIETVSGPGASNRFDIDPAQISHCTIRLMEDYAKIMAEYLSINVVMLELDYSIRKYCYDVLKICRTNIRKTATDTRHLFTTLIAINNAYIRTENAVIASIRTGKFRFG